MNASVPATVDESPPHAGRAVLWPRGEAGSAVVEFSLVAVLLLMLFLGIAQLAIYLHVRNVAAASAAEGARYGANADVSPEEGATRTAELLRRGLGDQTGSRLECAGRVESGPDGVTVTTVRCAGAIPVFFAPLGELLPVRVSARSVEEGQ